MTNCRRYNRILGILIICLACFQTPWVMAQDTTTAEADSVAVAPMSAELADENVLEIPPLFEYIVAPENLPDLQSRTNYIMDNFWNPFDFKNTQVVDQNALNHAFEVYVKCMPYASEKNVRESVKKLIGKLKGNPGLSYMFTKAAEEYLYGPRAVIWYDEVYVDFLKNLIDNKKISEKRKKKYIDQYALLKSTLPGTEMPKISVETVSGAPSTLSPSKEYTVVGFVPEVCDDCNYAKFKLDISGKISDLLNDGRLEIDIVALNSKLKEEDWPETWNLYTLTSPLETLDIRRLPCFYILDKNRKIVRKNLSADDVIYTLESLTTSSKK